MKGIGTAKNTARSLALLLALVLSLPAGACSKGTSTGDGTVEISGVVDLVPHAELIEFVAPKLQAKGVKIKLVSTAADATSNERTNNGEVDFNFFQHEPYLLSENETNGFALSSAGAIHVEPITAYSDRYADISEIKPGDSVAIPNNGTNEYRALRILEINGFIKLGPMPDGALSASAGDIAENTFNLEIVEIDANQIIPTKADYAFFIVNTNKALEAKLTSAKLFWEGSDSPYANIVAVNWNNLSEEKANAVRLLVAELQSDETARFIEGKYGGAVIPVFGSGTQQ